MRNKIFGALIGLVAFASLVSAQVPSGYTAIRRQAYHITTNTTNTPTSSTAYVTGIVITCSAAGTSWVFQIKNKEGTAKILYSATLAAGTTVLAFNQPIVMTSGIDIVTVSGTPGTVDVFITYLL